MWQERRISTTWWSSYTCFAEKIQMHEKHSIHDLNDSHNKAIDWQNRESLPPHNASTLFSSRWHICDYSRYFWLDGNMWQYFFFSGNWKCTNDVFSTNANETSVQKMKRTAKLISKEFKFYSVSNFAAAKYPKNKIAKQKIKIYQFHHCMGNQFQEMPKYIYVID